MFIKYYPLSKEIGRLVERSMFQETIIGIISKLDRRVGLLRGRDPIWEGVWNEQPAARCGWVVIRYIGKALSYLEILILWKTFFFVLLFVNVSVFRKDSRWEGNRSSILFSEPPVTDCYVNWHAYDVGKWTKTVTQTKEKEVLKMERVNGTMVIKYRLNRSGSFREEQRCVQSVRKGLLKCLLS